MLHAQRNAKSNCRPSPGSIFLQDEASFRPASNVRRHRPSARHVAQSLRAYHCPSREAEMPSVLNWPSRGEWLLSNPKSPLGRNGSGFYHKADPPFAVLTVDFRSKTGTVRALQVTTPLSGLQLRQTADGPKFSANYAIGTNSGRFEATVFARYELEIEFSGTAITSVNAHPSTIDGGDNDVSSLSTQDKLQEAVRRALPLLPSEMAREVAAIFTPTAFAIMATMAALWAASHLAVVGEIADIALLITGGILMGRAAIDVGGDLAEFMT